ncbi:MAG: hypothetical protein WCD89_14300 [Anaerocolumna sp.]
MKNVLLQLLDDYKVANHALEALAKFKDPELYEMIQSYIALINFDNRIGCIITHSILSKKLICYSATTPFFKSIKQPFL